MSRVRTPAEYGLPEEFSTWRPGQEEALEMLSKHPKRCDALCAPTGFGKSSVNVAHALDSRKPTVIVTSTLALQNQYMDKFKSIGMVELKGRRNYHCDMRPDDPDYTCEDGYAASCPYKGSVACDCSKAELEAATSSLIVTNYAKFTSSRMFGTGWNHIKQVIFDEAHDAPQALAAAMRVTLHYKEIEKDLKLDFPKHPECEEFAHWRQWIHVARSVAEGEMTKAKAAITGVANPKPTHIRHFSHMKNLHRNLGVLAAAPMNTWIVEETDEGYVFDPISPGRYAEGALLFGVDHIIMVSATLRPKTLYMVGLGKDKFTFQEFDSDFDRKRCPIYYVPTMRVDAKAGSLESLWLRVDQIAARRRDRNGIIHTISYARQQDIQRASRFSTDMIINEKGEPSTEALSLYRQTYPGAILVSPVFGTGYDFPLKQCEWQFLCKIPFEPPSKIVKAREALDKEYRGYQAIQYMVQAFGRGMRSKTDQCENFIGDDHLKWFLPKFGHLAPKSFHGFFQEAYILPQPPARLV